MRVFPIYAPKLIVKHVRIFLNGVIWVKDLGRVEFQHGRFLIPKETIPKNKATLNELNSLIEIQSQQSRSA